MNGVSYQPVRSDEEVTTGAPLAARILAKIDLDDGDILVVPQKVVSKAEGRCVRLDGVTPSARAVDLARTVGKPPELVEVILAESRRVVRAAPGVLIVETSHGFVCANGGVDRSNVKEGWVCLLPEEPDRSAQQLRQHLESATGVRIGVVVSDTFGRPWRLGQQDVAVGASGVLSLLDLRGTLDRLGRRLEVSELAIADGIAAGAGLLMGKREGVIAVRARGLSEFMGDGSVRDLLRPAKDDLFR
jgi:coenzyme F420-0:L-glutamate ligase/coenzyme F420-1:gamma-L-glutamate ligase